MLLCCFFDSLLLLPRPLSDDGFLMLDFGHVAASGGGADETGVRTSAGMQAFWSWSLEEKLHTHIIRYIDTPFPTKCDLGVVVPQIKLQLRGAQVLGMELEPQEVDKPRQCLQKKTILQYFYIYIHLCTSL